MLAEESEPEVDSPDGEASGVPDAQLLVEDDQVSPTAQAQFGASLVSSKQAVQDLAQLEVQLEQPSEQTPQVALSSERP